MIDVLSETQSYPSHPGKSMKRSDCPYFNVICNFCKIKGHIRRVCKKAPSSTNAITESELEAAIELQHPNVSAESTTNVSYIFVSVTISEEAQQTTSVSAASAVSVPHMEWTGNKFEKQAPLPSPKMTIRIEVYSLIQSCFHFLCHSQRALNLSQPPQRH